MSQKEYQRKSSGFTIIEVMIVLAIAGLIMLIVFLAVPALQRNARAAQRRADAANTLAGVNEFVTNNGGSLPTTFTLAGNILTISGGASTAASTVKMGYYLTAGSVSLVAGYAAPAPVPTDTLTIYTGTKCTNATTSAAGATRQLAAVFGLESNGAYVWQCTES